MSERLNQYLQQTLSKGRVCISQPAYCPAISLYLFDAAVLEGPLSHDEAQAVVAEPAYWSFCWASGQALAHYLLKNEALVKDKTVVDFGCGSGIVAIAAALAGASKIYACDIDQHALAAVAENARLNNVSIELISDLNAAEAIDVILAADVLYDKDNYPLLEHFLDRADSVIVADSRVRQLPSDHYVLQDCLEARTWPDLNEFEEFNQVRIYLSAPWQKS
jgi:predicted nicotinamide N-methyase